MIAPNYALKLKILRLLAKFTPFTLEVVREVDAFDSDLESEREFELSAMINIFFANAIRATPSGYKLAHGYVLAAFNAFKLGELVAICHHMKSKYPYCPSPPASLRFHDFSRPAVHAPPPVTASGDASSSAQSSREHKTKASMSDHLDALT
jgi:hypothetical protein